MIVFAALAMATMALFASSILLGRRQPKAVAVRTVAARRPGIAGQQH